MVKLVNIMLYVMNMPDFLSIFHPLHPPSLRWFRCATLFWDGVFDPLRNVMIGFPLIAVCPYAPWCWYIYLQNWVILFGQMLVNIQHHGAYGFRTSISNVFWYPHFEKPASMPISTANFRDLISNT